MSTFEMLCVCGAALAAVLAAGRLLISEILEADATLQPDLAPATGARHGRVKKAKARKLVECDACHRSYSARAVVCPNCGQPPRVNDPFSVIPLVLIGIACIAYTASFGPDEEASAAPEWSQAPALQKLRAALIHELEDKRVIASIRVAPHVVTVEVEQPAFRALKQFEQQTVGGTVFGYYFDGASAGDFVALEDAKTHQGLGWFNRWGLHLADTAGAVPAAPASNQRRRPPDPAQTGT